MATKISIDFILTGKFDPDKITTLMGIKPTNTWKLGDSIQNTKLRRKHDGWKLSIDKEESLDLNEKIESFLMQLESYSMPLKEIYEKLNAKAEIACAIYIEDEQVPAIHFNHETIKRVSDLGAEIDVDFYLF
jgi:hypothetical protein